MANLAIPTIDLSPFLNNEDDDNCKKKVKEIISQACSEYGFFQVVNHGVPLNLLSRAMELSKTYFAFPEEEKLKCSPKCGAPLPAGYNKAPEFSPEKKEYMIMFPPDSGFNTLPSNPPEFKDVMEAMFSHFSKAGELIESLINVCLGLPQNFLKEYNHDRSWDFMLALHYFAATETENNGTSEHEDGNCITLVVQDESGGLEVYKNGEWIPVIPEPGKIVVNIGDSIQVLTNKKFKSATHRVVRPKGRSRHSFAFFYTLQGDKWVEPLPQFTEEIGETAKFRGFFYKDYLELRTRSKLHPQSRPEDVIRIAHYAISTS
ncbi:flavonol synthase/flavanone 3-hydroxylase-like [Coffea eugenioides]|uniref:flavonol synthase/flavanone 3-hydroxylase-like n=1 Tax=Coffea eugenioides TaxID=49369 RepID=UPI000F608FCA|nr:flavonol synthase/flavanone 3-hydroxylase-like [Coffea eugenioides]